jgi:outer membrane protein OmpA-like peptidoglycan-associated protein
MKTTMKSKLILFVLVMTVALSATAQDKYVGDKATDNIFLSLGVGATASMYNEGGINIGDAIAPHVTLSVGKWFTPAWAVRLQGGLWEDKLNTGWRNSGPVVSGVELPGAKQSYGITTGRVRLDGLFNLTNAILGYNPERLLSLSVFAGPGFTVANSFSQVEVTMKNNTWSKTHSNQKLRAYINASAGLQAKFNVSSAWDIDVEARGELSPSSYGTLAPSVTTGSLYLTVGATYTFGGKNFVRCGESVDMAAINNDLNRYRQELSEARAELERQRAALAAAKPTTIEVEVIKEVAVAGPRAVFFPIGSTKIDDFALENIKLAAQVIKANPGKKYTVTGYADSGSGSVATNEKIATKRAQVVYDALIAQGVSADQLIMASRLSDLPYATNKLNRVVILE